MGALAVTGFVSTARNATLVAENQGVQTVFVVVVDVVVAFLS